MITFEPYEFDYDQELDQVTNDRVLEKLIGDGVEMRNTIRMLSSWFSENHHIVFVRYPTGTWGWKYLARFDKPTWLQGRFDTFHELLEALLKVISNATP